MKRFVYLALAGIVGWLANTSVATAGLIAPGDTTTSVGATDLPLELTTPAGVSGPIVFNSGAMPYANGLNTGTLQEIVVSDALNPLGAGHLTVLMQIHVTGGDANRVTTSAFGPLILTDVAYNAALAPFVFAPGTHVPLTADRSLDGATVGFNFTPPIASQIVPGPNGTSVALIIRTNGDFLAPGFIGVIDGSGTPLPGEVPTLTPEPASVVLLGFGVAGMLGYGWKRRKVLA